LRSLLLAILSGLLYTVSFPIFNHWYCAWVFAVPLFFALDGKNACEAFFYGLVSGLVAWAGTIYWVAYVMLFYGGMSLFPASLLLFLLMAYLCLYFSVFACISRRFLSSRYAYLTLPALWIFLEIIRSRVPFSGFPWALVGHSQLPFLQLAQIAEIGGVYFISGLVILGNVSIYKVFRKHYSLAIVSLGIIVGVFVWGHWRLQESPAEADTIRARAAVAQANIPQEEKWGPERAGSILDTYIRLTEQAMDQGAEIVVWPETACPFYLFREWTLTPRVLALSRESPADLLVGSPAHAEGNLYNRVWLLRKGAIEGFYDKVRLVPFGEYLPFADILEPIFGGLTQGVGNFSSGGQIHPISGIGVLICFESIFPDISRKLSLQGAEYLANVSNDAWFRTWSTPEQHLQMACFRAIETRRWLLRSVNHGISAIVDPFGRTVARIELLEEGVVLRDITRSTEMTFHTRYGALVCWIWMVFGGIGALTRYFKG